ncbi:hypothetical protein FIU95_02915 [Microbulbifer sp. THAF38]|nr:hypothetical protein FIU95_02915 [Microbulbifer sp. THAF38]
MNSLLGGVPIVLLGFPVNELDYQKPWCSSQDGVIEFVLPDRTRVDCLTATHAVEFDFAPKWAESIGQALYYAGQTRRRAGVVLILRDSGDVRYLRRLRSAVASAGLALDIWTLGPAKDPVNSN